MLWLTFQLKKREQAITQHAKLTPAPLLNIKFGNILKRWMKRLCVSFTLGSRHDETKQNEMKRSKTK